jgi:predicted ester cyclase
MSNKIYIRTPVNNGDNIWNSNQISRVKHIADRQAAKKFKQAKNPAKTGVIPPFFNMKTPLKSLDSDSEFSDSASDSASSDSSDGSNFSVDITDPMCFMNRCENLVDNRFHERKFVKKSKDKNNFLTQFDDLRFDNTKDPVSANAVPHNNSKKARWETERDLALKGGFSNFEKSNDMTFDVVSKHDLTNFSRHLKPFFGSKSGYGDDIEQATQQHDQSQRRMEMFTGSIDNLDYRPKEERIPLFNPVFGMTNMYGSPVMTDFYEKRYNPSKERRNEKPFEPDRVTPGIGVGAKTVSTFGVQLDPFRIMPKTVDELRPANKPKITYGNVIIPGLKGKRGPIASKVFKRRPLTYREYGPEWMIKGVGDYRAQSLSGEINPKNMATTNRGTKMTPQIGPAKLFKSLPTPESLIAKVKDPLRQNFKQAEPRNVVRANGKNVRAVDFNDIPDNTNREKYARTDRAGAAVGNNEINNNRAVDFNDIPDMTQREMFANTDRAGAGVGNNQINNNKAVDFNDIPDNTQRNMYARTDRAGAGVGNNQINNNRAVNFNDIPDMTQRNMYARNDRAGAGIGDNQMNKVKAQDFNDIPDMTQRNMYARNDRAGAGVGNNQINKVKAQNFNDIPDMTQRNMYARTDRAGAGVGNNQINKVKAQDFNDIPDMTQRELFANTDRAGAAFGGLNQFNKVKAQDFNDIPNMTQRELFANTDRAGAAFGGLNQFNKVKAQDFNDIPDMTQRELFANTDRAGAAFGGLNQFNKVKAQDFNDIPDMTQRELFANTDRAGAAFGGLNQFNKVKAQDFNDIPDMTQREKFARTDRAGAAFGGLNQFNKVKAQDFNDIPDMTQRELFARTDRAGAGLGANQFNKVKAQDFNDIPDMTQREMFSRTDRAGFIGNNENSKVKAQDFDDIPDMTQREMFIKTDRVGLVGNKQFNKSKSVDWYDIPDMTQREKFIKTDRVGLAGNKQFNKSRAIDWSDIPDMTQREMFSRYDRAGVVGPVNAEKTRTREDINNMTVNISKEEIAKGRRPTNSSYSKGPTMDFTMVQMCEPLQINRDLYPQPRDIAQKRMPSAYTRFPQRTPTDTWHFYTHVEENLKGNPYINNVIHQSPVG